ncbi:LysR family transcriptional regulator [Chamaesiphon sp. OTE_8_metabat_110]|uniref:LysR family transcriptional regulator n=1 Tax=Chamaesiphon sp. OTE_8_metabat_110 TaxID=2964696 RepID=UPI00286ABC96|nr:LysR family transcriptional regulator [Chamaesiphon sp. OTE_8_metabat_110]
MDLRNFDLNLLVVLHTLIAERSVSNTAKKLHLSQPATSAALKRLRVALDDRILVRDGLQMVLTPRAEELFAPLTAILGEIDRTLTASEIFNPAKVERTMRIATNDYGAFILIPPLMNRLQSIAPNIDVEVWEIGRDAIAALKEGKIDLAICDGWTLKQCQCTEVLFSETFTCLARAEHPRIQGELTIDRYLAEEHILVSPRGRVRGHVDAVLARQGWERRVRLTLPHVLAVPAAVSATDCIVTIASRIAHQLAASYDLQILSPPIDVGDFQVAMAWRSALTNDLAIQWLQGELRSICAEI